VTKSGTDTLQGLVALLRNGREPRIAEHHRRAAHQGASSGNPIQNIKDYGIEAGGPLKKGKAWIGAPSASRRSASASSASSQPMPRARRSRPIRSRRRLST
jgi:hypothetical protein